MKNSLLWILMVVKLNCMIWINKLFIFMCVKFIRKIQSKINSLNFATITISHIVCVKFLVLWYYGTIMVLYSTHIKIYWVLVNNLSKKCPKISIIGHRKAHLSRLCVWCVMLRQCGCKIAHSAKNIYDCLMLLSKKPFYALSCLVMRFFDIYIYKSMHTCCTFYGFCGALMFSFHLCFS